MLGRNTSQPLLFQMVDVEGLVPTSHRVDSLNESPHRFAVAEPESTARSVEIRRVTFGDHLAFYRVDEARAEVQLLGFRHGARRRDPEAGSL